MENTVLFVLTHIICPLTVVVIGGLIVIYHKIIWRWLGKLLKEIRTILTVITFSPFKKGLGIQELDRKLTEIEETALYTIVKQIEIDERLTKIEEATRNPNSHSSQSDNTESGEE